MTIHVSKRALYKALTKVISVCGKDGSVLLEKKTDIPLKIRTFSGDSFFELENANVRGEGKFILPARKLQAIVKPDSKKDDGLILIEAMDEGDTRLVVDDLETIILKFSKEIPSVPKSGFKRVLQYFAKKFLDHLTYVLPAMSGDEERERIYCLGVLDGQVVATDGHRMHCDTLSAELKEPVVVRAPSIKILYKLLKGEKGELTVSQSKKYIRFVATRGDSKWTFVCKKNDLDFPPYREVIPAVKEYVVAEVGAVKKVLERTKAVMEGNSHSVKLEVTGEDLCFTDGDLGNCLTKVKILSRVGGGSGQARWIDIRYFIDALKVDDNMVKISTGEVHEPLFFDFGDRTALIMPRRDR